MNINNDHYNYKLLPEYDYSSHKKLEYNELLLSKYMKHKGYNTSKHHVAFLKCHMTNDTRFDNLFILSSKEKDIIKQFYTYYEEANIDRTLTNMIKNNECILSTEKEKFVNKLFNSVINKEKTASYSSFIRFLTRLFSC